ncbi:MAG TPA: hypothetical protein VGM41_08700 [Chitinophagaceae bacterium]|jgi:hypothetical protein
MNMTQLNAYGSFFTSNGSAKSFVKQADETVGKPLVIIMWDAPYFFVCSPRLASQLVKQGYEYAEQVSYL